MRAVFAGLVLLANVGTASALEFGGWTTMFYSSSHGTQVEYLALNGKSYLWYPGNSVVLIAPWKLFVENSVCYRYDANTYNPVTGTRGGRWRCVVSGIYRAMATEQVKGDVFGLVEASRRGTVPFVLPRGKTTIGSLSEGKATGTALPGR